MTPPVGTPLKPPAPLTEEQAAEINQWVFNESVTPETVTDETKALLWHVLKRCVLDDSAVVNRLVAHQFRNMRYEDTEYPLSMFHAELLIGERLSLLDSVIAQWSGSDILAIIHSVLLGYCYSDEVEERIPLTSITTEEELAAVTAVAIFITNVRRDQSEQCVTADFHDATGKLVSKSFRMANTILRDHLKQHPHDVNRVLEYISTRHIGRDKESAEGAIQYLKEAHELGVLADGWV